MIKARIETAGPFADADLKAIKDGFCKLIGQELEFEIVQNPCHIGGFVAYIDGKIYDATIKTQLSEIDERLTKEDDWI